MKRRGQQPGEVGGLDLLEEAVHTLRTAPFPAIAAYYLGSIPFVLALLFFWSEMSRSPFAEQRLIGSALRLTLLFAWMKFWQSVSAGLIRQHIGRETGTHWTFNHFIRVLARQLAVHPMQLFLLPVGLFVVLPFGWLFAFSQNVTVLAARGDEPLRVFLKRAWKQAAMAQISNHLLMSALFFFGLFVWLNIAIGLVTIPLLAKMLFGVETPFTLSMESTFNTTFLASVTGLAYLAVDPLVKTAYALRCFHGESRQTGEDLRVGLRRFAATAAAMLLLVATPVGGQAAESSKPTPQAPSPARELDRSISDVLSKPEYSWRSPRQKRILKRDAPGTKFFERMREWVRTVSQGIVDWLRKVFGRSRGTAPTSFSFFSGKGLAYTLIVVVAVIIGLLLYFIWKVRWKKADGTAVAQVAAAPPDLTDENVTAEQLPEDSWLKLGMELAEQGDLRLALRAFYLASLVHLSERNLVTLARFKSNRDYERELLRRSHAIPDLAEIFSGNVATFDRVWYGLHEVTAELLQHFRVNVERIKSC